MKHIEKILVGSSRWAELRKLPPAKAHDSISELTSALGAIGGFLHVFMVPELAPGDAFVEYADGSIERLA